MVLNIISNSWDSHNNSESIENLIYCLWSYQLFWKFTLKKKKTLEWIKPLAEALATRPSLLGYSLEVKSISLLLSVHSSRTGPPTPVARQLIHWHPVWIQTTRMSSGRKLGLGSHCPDQSQLTYWMCVTLGKLSNLLELSFSSENLGNINTYFIRLFQWLDTIIHSKCLTWSEH